MDSDIGQTDAEQAEYRTATVRAVTLEDLRSINPEDLTDRQILLEIVMALRHFESVASDTFAGMQKNPMIKQMLGL